MAPKTKRAMSQGEKDTALMRKRARTQERKDARREAQELRRQANVVRERMGVPTAWQKSRQLRAFNRRYVLAA